MIVPQKSRSAGDRRAEPPSDWSVDHLLRPAPSARLLARVRAAALDRALLAGTDPAHSSQLAARAHALTSPRSRAAAADGLERWLSAADGATSRRRVLPRRVLAAANTSEAREILSLLRGPAPLYAPGIALLGSLLSDGSGPAYRGDSDQLTRLLRAVRATMTGQARAGDRSMGRHPARLAGRRRR